MEKTTVIQKEDEKSDLSGTSYGEFSRESVERFSRERYEPAWMLAKRMRAWTIFSEMPGQTANTALPVSRRIDLKELKLENLKRPTMPRSVTQPAADPPAKGVILTTLQDAVRDHPALVEKYFMSECVQINDSKFAALHAAFWDSGTFLYVPKNVSLELPIENIIAVDTDATASFPHTIIVAEEGASVTIVETLVPNEAPSPTRREVEGLASSDTPSLSRGGVETLASSDAPSLSRGGVETLASSDASSLSRGRVETLASSDASSLSRGRVETYRSDENKPQVFVDSVVEIIAHEGSAVKYIGVQLLGSTTFNFAFKKALVKKDASVIMHEAGIGSRVAHSNIQLILEESGANGELYGIYFPGGEQQMEFDTLQVHAAPSTKSNLLYKGALQNKSKTVFNGIIQVHKGAQRTDAYQANRNILLSSDARADSIPTLEIEANDVRCTHGATVGPVDEDVVFYLMSRGLSREEARRMLVVGFMVPVIDTISVEKTREEILGHIRSRIAS